MPAHLVKATWWGHEADSYKNWELGKGRKEHARPHALVEATLKESNEVILCFSTASFDCDHLDDRISLTG